MNVLLLSPMAGRDPLSGDTSYTAALLADAPPGVNYVPYGDALADGTLTIRGRDGSLRGTGIFASRSVELGLRRVGVMFRESTWWVTVDSSYDVVHSHLFNLRQVGSAVPVVSSFGYPLQEHYRHRERWPQWRLRLAVDAEIAWARLAKVHVPWLHQVAPSVMTGYSTAATEYLVDRGAAPLTVRRISTGLEALSYGPRASTGRSLLFVGRDFDRKGGAIAIKAFERLSEQTQGCSLTVVTHPDVPRPPLPTGVTWRVDIDRRQLLAEILPAADLLVLPTSMDCGAPYAVLEALQCGVPVVISELPWLDERLVEPAVTRADPTPDSVAAAIESVLEPSALVKARSAARTLWEQHFSMKILGTELAAAYSLAASLTENSLKEPV